MKKQEGKKGKVRSEKQEVKDVENVQGITAESLFNMLRDLADEQEVSDMQSAISGSVGHLFINGKSFEVQLTLQSENSTIIQTIIKN